ncbi:MAG: PH domain-containing protein [Deltaproteobacteria bacterium]|nr:PH domain-containing protein [Deltaproteobacteria bacterium]
MAENILYQNHPSWLNSWGLFLLAVIFFLILTENKEPASGIFIAAIFVLLAVIKRYRNLYTVTDLRVMMRVGLISNNTNEMELKHIRGMNIRQNVIERLMGIGTLVIISTADGGGEVVFQGSGQPEHLKDQIREVKEKYYGMPDRTKI